MFKENSFKDNISFWTDRFLIITPQEIQFRKFNTQVFIDRDDTINL